jgi:hypothetical protein
VIHGNMNIKCVNWSTLLSMHFITKTLPTLYSPVFWWTNIYFPVKLTYCVAYQIDYTSSSKSKMHWCAVHKYLLTEKLLAGRVQKEVGRDKTPLCAFPGAKIKATKWHHCTVDDCFLTSVVVGKGEGDRSGWLAAGNMNNFFLPKPVLS